MYKFVDDSDEQEPKIEGFAYTNRRGVKEYVHIREGDSYGVIELLSDERHSLDCFYVADIPKLVKALQAAYDHVQKVDK